MVDEQIDSHVFSSIGCLRRSPGAYVCWHTMRLADVVWPRAVSDEDRQGTAEEDLDRLFVCRIRRSSSLCETKGNRSYFTGLTFR